jgi:CRP/FNR family cyclic AMP-dependent transcriptional regulator
MQASELVDIPLFQGLSGVDQARLAPLFAAVSFGPDQVVFNQGDPATRLYILREGQVALRLYPEDGGCLTIALIQAQGIFGWSAVLGRERYTSAAVSVSAAQAVALEGRALRRLLRGDVRLGRRLLGRLTLALADRGAAPDAELPVPPALLTRLIQAEISQAGVPV